MTDTQTRRAGLGRLLNYAAALAFLLMVAGSAFAQTTYYVDPNGGSNARNGLQRANGVAPAGPKATIEGALAVATSGDTIVLLAGVYDDMDSNGFQVGTTPSNGRITIDTNNITFRASSESTQNRVVFNVPVELYGTGITFAAEGAATFALAALPAGGFASLTIGQDGATVNPGSADLGSGIFRIGEDQTGTAVTGIAIQVNETGTASGLTGSPVFVTSPSVLYGIDSGAAFTTGAELPSNFSGAGSNLIVSFDGAAAGTLTLDKNVVLGDGAVVNVAANDAISGNLNVVAGPTGSVDFVGANGVYGNVTVTSGTLNDGAGINYAVNSVTLNGGLLDASGQVVTVMGSFVQTNGLFAPAGSLLFDGATGTLVFDPQSNLVVENFAIGDGTAPEPTTVDFQGDVTVNNQFVVSANTTASLSGDQVNINGTNGDATVNGMVTDGVIGFNNDAQTLGGTGVVDDIEVNDVVSNGTSVSLAAGANLQFTGNLALLGVDGFNVTTGTDFSPLGADASVSVNMDDVNNFVKGAGTFNADNQNYDLSYFEAQRNNVADAAINYIPGREFDLGNIKNLLVDASEANFAGNSSGNGASITAVAGNEVLGTFIVRNGNDPTKAGTQATNVVLPAIYFEVAGSVTVEANSAIVANGAQGTNAAPAIVGLELNAPENTVGGVLDGSTVFLTDGVTVNGVIATGTQARVVADVVLLNSAAASLLTLRAVDGDIYDNAAAAAGAGTLTVSLASDTDPSPGQFNQEKLGNLNGVVTLDYSTLKLASGVQLTADAATIEISTLNTDGNVFFLEGIAPANGPLRLELKNDVQGTGAVWPSSGNQIVNGLNHTAITIPVFHPGDENSDRVSVGANIRVNTTLRITGILDAETLDGTPSGADYAVTLQGDPINGNEFALLAVDDGYTIFNDGGGEPENVVDKELVIVGPIDFTTFENGTVNPYSDLNVLATENVQTFTVMDDAELNAVDASYTVVNFVTNAAGSLDLATNDLSVMEDATLGADGAVYNSFAGGSRVTSGGLPNPNYSTFAFIGDVDGTLTVVAAPGTGVTTFGDGVDLKINKTTPTTTVTLAGAPLVFDDEFGGGSASDDDETLVLQRGILKVGVPSAPNDVYIRLDHTNAISGATTSDNGQGFVFVPEDNQFPEAFVQGNVRKRIISVQSDTPSSRRNPGRVVYPVGADPMDDADRGYAEYVLDFESITQSQSFGQRNVTVSFVSESPGGNNGLPIDGGDGINVTGYPGFYWSVTANPALGAGTFFNVEARADEYDLDVTQNVDDLRLIRRQSGDETTNPYTLVSTMYDNFLLDPDPNQVRNGNEEPVVVAQNAEAFLGPQATFFTYGSNLIEPTPPNSIQLQVVHMAPTAPSPVDVYVNGNKVADDLGFSSATPYQTVTGITLTQDVTVAIAPGNSTGAGSAIYTETVSVTQGGFYAVIAIDGAAPGSVDVKALNQGSNRAASSTSTEIRAFHALKVDETTDGPTVDIGLFGGAAQFASVAYGAASPLPALVVDPAPLQFVVYPDGMGNDLSSQILATKLDLSPAIGERGFLIAQGLLSGSVTQPSRNATLVFVRPNGQIIRGANNTSAEATTEVPADFALVGTFPNPTTTTTNLTFDLPEAADVTVRLFDVTGRQVMTKTEAGLAAGARQQIRLDAGSLASGVYVYQVTVEGASRSFAGSGRMTVTR